MDEKYHRLSKGKDENGKRILIDEHRYVMEKHLGRKLKRNEIVHHIDGNKSNNNIENLTIMSLSEHARLHATGRAVNEKTKQKLREKNLHKPFYRRKSKKQIIEIVEKYKELKTYRKVDKFFNFCNGTTGRIIRGNEYYDYQELVKKILNSN